MGVLTHEEYADIQEEKNVVVKPESANRPLSVFAFEKTEIEYHLFHPDNSSYGRINNKYNVQIEGKKFELDIIDGVIVTNDENIKSHLIAKGFIFLYGKETEMGKQKDNKVKGSDKPEDKEIEIKEKAKDEEVKVEEVEVEAKSDEKDYCCISTFCKDKKDLKKACTQKMFVPFAPKGECHTGFWFKDKEIKVTLTDGIVFVDPKDNLMIEEMEKQDFQRI